MLRHPLAGYESSDPAAYLARYTLRSNLVIIVAMLVGQLVSWGFVFPRHLLLGIVASGFFGLPLVLRLRTLGSGGAVAIAVDRPGVFFGESSGAADPAHRLVPWGEICAVVVYQQIVRGDENEWLQPAVGVRLTVDPTRVDRWRFISGWHLDRSALEAAVARFAPEIPVLDGPPQKDHSY